MLWATLGTSSPLVHFSINLDDRCTPVKTSFKFKEEATTSNTTDFSCHQDKTNQEQVFAHFFITICDKDELS